MRVHNRQRISRQKYTILFSSDVADISALTASKIADVNRKTADSYFNLFHQVIFKKALQERQYWNLKNGIELDESYFGAKRIRRKRRRGARGKISIVGLLKIGGKVCTKALRTVQENKYCQF